MEHLDFGGERRHGGLPGGCGGFGRCARLLEALGGHGQLLFSGFHRGFGPAGTPFGLLDLLGVGGHAGGALSGFGPGAHLAHARCRSPQARAALLQLGALLEQARALAPVAEALLQLASGAAVSFHGGGERFDLALHALQRLWRQVLVLGAEERAARLRLALQFAGARAGQALDALHLVEAE